MSLRRSMTQTADPQGAPSNAATGMRTRTSRLAIASLTFAILWFLWVGSVLAIILGLAALRGIKAGGYRERGRGIARAGIVLGTLELLILLATILGGDPGSGGVAGPGGGIGGGF